MGNRGTGGMERLPEELAEAVECSPGGRVAHRLSLRGDRQLDRAIHMAALSGSAGPTPEGHAHFDPRLSEGRIESEALESLRREVTQIEP